MLATRLMAAMVAAGGGGNIQYVGGYVRGFVGTTSNITVTLTSLSGGLGSSPATGDIVIVYFGTASGSDQNLVVNGYTEVGELFALSTRSTNLVVAYKIMGATPDTSFTLTGGTLSTFDAGAVAVQVWRGVNATTPLDVTSTTATKTNSVLCNPPDITPITSGSVIISGGAGAHIAGTATYSSSNLTGFISVGGNDNNDATVGLGYYSWTSGSFDPAQFTFSGADSGAYSCASVTVALRPA